MTSPAASILTVAYVPLCPLVATIPVESPPGYTWTPICVAYSCVIGDRREMFCNRALWPGTVSAVYATLTRWQHVKTNGSNELAMFYSELATKHSELAMLALLSVGAIEWMSGRANANT
ncbi:hypothetical protein THAOC_30795 [Thalassiosira oceanica]|uniref:Uncharacterized protein n=1 Tax=Thalassiosira oceanica TaxID=159749 RepID=K0RUE9_THAOC|nr:hypothetical protein THAOC_30795 [Thalassiosira oceanica]|eukprot:EJK50262.1 hypothetical protein THAOC_30795 [Thalassiosira oceanica]